MIAFDQSPRCAMTKAAILALFAGLAQGGVVSWLNPVSGNWDEGVNWSTGSEPTPADAVEIAVAGVFTVSIRAAESVDQLSISNSDAILEIQNGRALTVSSAAASSATLANDATIVVNSNAGTSFTRLLLGDADTQGVLSSPAGTGEVILNVSNINSDVPDATIEFSAGGIHGQGHTVRGKGTVAGAFTNEGLIIADRAGQELRITADIVQSPGGTVAAADNGVLGLATGASITGGMVVTSNGGSLQAITGTSTIQGGLINLGDAGVRSGAVLTLGPGGVVNDGTITVNSNAGTSFTTFRVDDATTISGSGTIDLNVSSINSDLPDATLSTNTGITATIAPQQSVTGKGVLSGSWINNGTISGNRSGQDLRITAAVDQTAGGTIRGENAGTAVLYNAQVTGGTFESDETGAVHMQIGGNTIEGVTNLGNAGVRNGAQVSLLAGGLTNHGDLVINTQSSTSFTRLAVTEDATIDGIGTITLNLSDLNSDLPDARLESIPGVVATQGLNHTIRGKGEIVGEWINHGTIAADRAGQSIRIDGALTQSATGVVRGDNNGVILLQTTTLTGGTVDSSTGGSVQFNLASNAIDAVTSTGDFGLLSGAVVDLQSGGLVNNGSFAINSNASTATTRMLAPADASITGTGTILLGVTPINTDISDANLGAVDDAVLTIGPGQTITGKGQLSGNVVVEGTIAPGNPAHATTVNLIFPRPSGTGGRLTLAPSAEFAVEASAQEVNDRLSSTVPVDLAGTLRFTPIEGFDPPRPTRYTIIDAPEFTGTFDTLIYEGTIPEGGVFRVVYEDTEVIAAVTCKADVAAPIGVLDLSDISLFIALFQQQSTLVDLAAPFGILDLADINTFVVEFLAGCGT